MHLYEPEGQTLGALCSSGSQPGTLIYADRTRGHSKLRFLDCTDSSPFISTDRKPITTRQSLIHHICCIEDHSPPLVVTSSSYEGSVCAHDLNSGDLLWHLSGRPGGIERYLSPRSVISDGEGHLLVADYNNKCLLMFSLEGTHLYTLLNTQQPGLGAPSSLFYEQHSKILTVKYYQNREHTLHRFRLSLQ